MKKIEEIKKRAAKAATFRARRKAAGLDIVPFARRYGFDAGQVSRWENGENIPTNRLIKKVERAFEREGV